MSDILITGGSGFVGSNLKSYLKMKNFNLFEIIRGVIKNQNSMTFDECSIGDFNDKKAFIHLAGKAHDLKRTSDIKSYFEVNTELTKQVYNKFLQSNCEIFIYMSSVKAVSDHVEGVLTEDTICKPKTAYGKSKLEAEKYILQNLPKNNNQKVYILRPCMIHGFGNKGNLNVLYNFIKKGIPFPFGAYKNERSFLSIDNLNFIIKEILKGSIKPDVYNLADSGTLSISKLVNIIGQASNNKVRIFNLPKWIVFLVAKTGDIVPFIPLNSEKLQKITENYIVDNSKLLKELKEVLPLPIDKGIFKTITHFK